MIEDALYDAILAAPEDDAPRLVYADRLIERGDPRGEFIAVECAVARLAREGARHTAEYRAAKARSDQLFSAHGGEWFDRVIGLARWEKQVTRGFISHASISAKALQVRWDRFGRMPLEEVTFHRRLTNLEYGPMGSPEIGRLAWLLHEAVGRRLRSVGLSTNSGVVHFDPAILAETLAETADSEEALSWPDDAWPDARLMPAVRGVNILSSALREQLIHQSPSWLPQLTSLKMDMESAEAMAFLDRPALPELRRLELGSRDRSGLDAAQLVRSSILSTPATLKLGARLDEALVHALDERATNLEALTLTAGATEAGLEAFAKSSLPSRLRSLVINNHLAERIRPRALASVPFRKLATLALEGFLIDDTTGKAFADNPAFATVIDLSLTHIPALTTLEAIAESPHFGATIHPFLGNEADPAHHALLRRRWGYRTNRR